MKNETWIEIEKGYFVSNMGRFKSVRNVKHRNNVIINEEKTLYLKLSATKKGYLTVSINCSNKYAHRIIASVFIPNESPKEKRFVNHKNGDRSDNRVENLEWCTNSENLKHAYKTGLAVSAKGEGHWKSKLSEKDVLKIRMCHSLGFKTKELSKDFNVSTSLISNIIARRIWRHI